jgi:hypothetical protein
MARIIPAKINNKLGKIEDQGQTLVFDMSVTKATVNSRGIHARQSTSVLIPHSDPFTQLSRSVGPSNFWINDELVIKHFWMIEGPHKFMLDVADSTLFSSVTFPVKRLWFYAGQYEGRITIRSNEEQTIKLSYA